VEHEYALRLMKLCQPAPADQRAVDHMHLNPTGWSLTHYEQLAQLLSVVAAESGESSTNVGDVKQYIESLSVSSESVCIWTLLLFLNRAVFMMFRCDYPVNLGHQVRA